MGTELLKTVADELQEKIDGVPGRDLPEGTIIITTLWSKTLAKDVVKAIHSATGGNGDAS